MFNRHEVPYASTMEGGRNALSRLALASQNKAHGGALGRFYKDNNLQPGDHFLVPLQTGGNKNPQPNFSPTRGPYSNPLRYLVPIMEGAEESEAAEIVIGILEGLLAL